MRKNDFISTAKIGGRKWLADLEAHGAEKERLSVERHLRRVVKGTAAKPRATCRCDAYPWPHRPGGGNCEQSHPAAIKWRGQAGRHPGTFGRVNGGSSHYRQRILKRYRLHPIRDRAYIRRWLPKLYAAISRREGWTWVYMSMGGYVPAMRVTEHGVPPDLQPYTAPDLFDLLMLGTRRKTPLTLAPIIRRLWARYEKRRRQQAKKN